MRILVLSDIHYASPAEQERRGYEGAAVGSGWRRRLIEAYRYHVWLRDPFAHNSLVDQFLDKAGRADLVVANGDFSCDSAFVGVSDDAAADSARTVLAKLRRAHGDAFEGVIGDHELGKVSLAGGCGGLRLASWSRSVGELGLGAFWRREVDGCVIWGLCSSLLGLPVYLPECLEEERDEWLQLRRDYIDELEQRWQGEDQRKPWILMLHDPTALPFLGGLPAMQSRFRQLEATIIGHLHSPLVFWKSRMLAGLPPVRFMGTAIRRMTEALSRGRAWRPFRVRLCPSLAGIELLKDGGYLDITRDTAGLRIKTCPILRQP